MKRCTSPWLVRRTPSCQTFRDVHCGHCAREQAIRKPIIEGVQDELDVLGKDGWELVSVQNIRLEDGRLFTVAYLKRQKP
jgi:hypothetical protein